ncbi:sulfatase family protein [Pontiella sulfatireligans]|uniref:Arylsulfatase n=1 Tax=Pontiella sulfatireligans TaxID=2750658 RepID=A0A6C2UJB2_9BACT|nr:sulfatase-like hydrolase/transferase [Pontiella sulfatireligans]SPS74396.1 sulfatase S1_44 [Kiritimatiellales bacterium]VGO19963.1 Arylsulfatase [Pontiella sulfatireligans]
MKIKSLLFVSVLSISAFAAERPNLLFIMMDDLGVGHCQFNNGQLTVEAFDPYFKELVAQRQDYTPEQALEFSKRAMPTLNRLAQSGAVFTRAYAPSSLCAPSRLAIATGLSLQKAGVYTNMDVESDGIKPGTHLAHQLQNAGYGTAHIGKWHVGKRDYQVIRSVLDRRNIEKNLSWGALRNQHPEIYNEAWDAGYYGSVVKEQNPLNNGFDYYYGYNNWASQFYDSTLVWENFEHAGRQTGYNTEVFTDKALGFMQKQVGKNKPFFVQLHYHAVHDYLEPNAPDRYWNSFRSPSYNLSNFYAHINAVDQNIQRLLDYLKKNGLLENTLIAFTSDNGAMSGGPSVLPGNAPFSGHKGMFYQGGIRVPLLFYWPEGIKAKGENDQLVSSMDILPTFIEAAGLAAPKNLKAKSLLGLLSDTNTAPVREQLVWAGIHARAWGFMINKSFKTKNDERNKAPGGWAIAKGDYVLRFTGTIEPDLYVEAPEGAAPKIELYNVKQDPAETSDLADQMPELVEAMKTEYLKRTPDFTPPVRWSKEKWQELVKQPASS